STCQSEIVYGPAVSPRASARASPSPCARAGVANANIKMTATTAAVSALLLTARTLPARQREFNLRFSARDRRASCDLPGVALPFVSERRIVPPEGSGSNPRGPVPGTVQTVLGPVDPGQLGPTMTHEHIFFTSALYADDGAAPADFDDVP